VHPKSCSILGRLADFTLNNGSPTVKGHYTQPDQYVLDYCFKACTASELAAGAVTSGLAGWAGCGKIAVR
jgi:hypothetical protein